jgi:hypothetical protein
MVSGAIPIWSFYFTFIGWRMFVAAQILARFGGTSGKITLILYNY